ncbi:DUF1861 family protein [Paenibacillus sp. LHD-117]|uniref:DUF1861 family protein n=1 Tax=Paenibacillus sp. LHD-117 TaxID=3071412 RepID=UPI0027E1E122|nr:DUF1861 family protein [Paenibacillus sp. LHD-117]MDQ6420345.1 DUF1861 family protein [Paenibacillus sp. LHD-117]
MTAWREGRTQACSELLAAYRAGGGKAGQAEKIVFDGMGDRDVYNIAAPFEDEGELVIAGRVESRDSEESEIWFFIRRGEKWVPKDGAPVFKLQDPFHTRIGGLLVFGGVQTFPHPEVENALSWRTVFYKGDGIASLERFYEGPDQMKDLRLVELADGSVGVFTRPQGSKGGRGKIGYTAVPSLERLTKEVVLEAPLLEQFLDEEWGGANEIHLLANGKLGVLGHVACFDERGDRHYYPMVFAYDPLTGAYTEMSLVAERADFVEGPTKRDDLKDVVFSGGIVRLPEGKAELYAGISDAEAQKIEIEDPFIGFE